MKNEREKPGSWEDRMMGPSDGWPASFQRLQHQGGPGPDVQARLRRALSPSRRRWPLPAIGVAALVLIGVSIGFWSFHLQDSSVLHITRSQPGASLLRQGEEMALPEGAGDHGIRPGDAILLTEPATLVFREGFTLSGPAALEILSQKEWRLRYGELTVSETGDRKVAGSIWITERNRYIRTGTTARLTVNPRQESMLVWRGSFRAETKGGESKEIHAGQKIITKEGNRSIETPLTAAELREEESIIRTFSSRPESIEPLPSRKEEREKRFGPLQKIRLKNGSVIVGYVLTDGQTIDIRTENRRIRLRRSEIASIESIQSTEGIDSIETTRERLKEKQDPRSE